MDDSFRKFEIDFESDPNVNSAAPGRLNLTLRELCRLRQNGLNTTDLAFILQENVAVMAALCVLFERKGGAG
jgi:hypothetical protein